jgi:hypothetical protein
MINKEIIITDKLVFNPWQNNGEYWVRYIRYHWTDEYYINSRIEIPIGFPFTVKFIRKAKYLEKLFNYDKTYKESEIEMLKEDIDQFLIKISKLQSFI